MYAMINMLCHFHFGQWITNHEMSLLSKLSPFLVLTLMRLEGVHGSIMSYLRGIFFHWTKSAHFTLLTARIMKMKYQNSPMIHNDLFFIIQNKYHCSIQNS
ncbi:hypothetical protein VCUG_00078 [Vavraia culicis subsp. floridensis]|uniref:Uncharacterized protein n=1 Tax=Vavraia culicis (isolate floridensis) TaxID=948595 RepID=L2GXW9_VAVCU|nr:uncharacterized protein VCUG_00078 [Vavraia culicis subsp. floridensis]ELA48469.1 hypothetical protein VCUG_00078 [Vavraia culicis subsp. floridensis]